MKRITMAIIKFLVILSHALSVLATSTPLKSHPPGTTIINQTRKAIQDFMAFDTSSTINQDILIPPKKTSKAIYMPMYDIDLFRKSSFKDYGALISHRLSGAARRAHCLFATMATAGTKLPLYPERQLPFLYAVMVSIGDPPKRVQLMIDTGSTLSWWNCSSDSYDSSRSLSYSKAVDCTSICENRWCYDKSSCRFRINYIGGEVLSGFLAYEKVTFAGDTIIDDLYFGCPDKMPNGFNGERRYIGLLALGTNGSFLEQVQAKTFSFCLPPHTSIHPSTLAINEILPAYTGTIKVTLLPNLISRPYRMVGLFGVYIDDTFLQFHTEDYIFYMGAAIDTGSTTSVFPKKDYEMFRDIFRQAVQEASISFLPITNLPYFDTCYSLIDNPTWTVKIPKITLVLGGDDSGGDDSSYDYGYHDNSPIEGNKMLTLSTEQVMMLVDDSRYCLAFTTLNTIQNTAIIGSWQLQGTRVSYDFQDELVHILPGSCNI